MVLFGHLCQDNDCNYIHLQVCCFVVFGAFCTEFFLKISFQYWPKRDDAVGGSVFFFTCLD